MKVIVFGATGKTGRIVCQQALERGYEITAFTRSMNKIDSGDTSLRVVQGDVMDADSVAGAVTGHDAAIVALGSNGLRDKSTLAAGTRNVVDGMTRNGIGRLVVLSAAGVEESWRQTPWMARIIFKTMLRNIYKDHEEQEATVKASSLDWTIVRAAILKNNPATGIYSPDNTGKVGHINRADVADFLVKQVNDVTYRKQAISITS